jgi:hypothetical protein
MRLYFEIAEQMQTFIRPSLVDHLASGRHGLWYTFV